MIKYHNPPFLLKEIKIEITQKCNLSCIHCSSDSHSESSLVVDYNKFKQIIDEAREIGVEELAISGGEPLLHPNILDMLLYSSEKGLRATVYTTGNVPSPLEMVSNLARLQISRLIFSVFSLDREVHERITRISGSLLNTLNFIREAQKHNISCEFHFVPFSHTYMNLPEVANYAKSQGGLKTSVLRFVTQGRGAINRMLSLSRMQNIELKKIIDDLRNRGYRIRTGSPYNFLLLNDQPQCSSGINKLIISPCLRVYPCDAFKQINAEDVVGTGEYSNLRDFSLRDVWEKSPYLQQVRRYLTTDFEEPCRDCAKLESCLSGCLAQKVISFGNFNKRPDPSCILKAS